MRAGGYQGTAIEDVLPFRLDEGGPEIERCERRIDAGEDIGPPADGGEAVPERCAPSGIRMEPSTAFG